MTETQYLLGWAAYLIGGTGCMIGLWLIIRNRHPRIKRFLMVLFGVIVYLPGITRPDMDYLAPAFLITLFDGLTYGPEGMIRTGKAIALIAGVTSLIALILPVSKKHQKTKKSQNRKKSSSGSGGSSRRDNSRGGNRNSNNDNGSHQRKEPTY